MRPGRVLAWTAFLAASLLALHGLGGPLAPPPLTAPSRLGTWAAARQPAEIFVALVRLALIGVLSYLLAATGLVVVAVAVRRPLVSTVADAVSVALVRRVVGGALGLSLAAAVLTGPRQPAAAASAHGPPAAMATTATTALTMQRLPDPPAPGGPPATDTAAPDAAAPAPVAPAAEPGPGRTWEIRPGQHFWAVAEAVLAEAWSRPPTDHEVDHYWRALVERNRPVLRDAANPDLLYPGQVLEVPPPPPPPG